MLTCYICKQSSQNPHSFVKFNFICICATFQNMTAEFPFFYIILICLKFCFQYFNASVLPDIVIPISYYYFTNTIFFSNSLYMNFILVHFGVFFLNMAYSSNPKSCIVSLYTVHHLLPSHSNRKWKQTLILKVFPPLIFKPLTHGLKRCYFVFTVHKLTNFTRQLLIDQRVMKRSL